MTLYKMNIVWFFGAKKWFESLWFNWILLI